MLDADLEKLRIFFSVSQKKVFTLVSPSIYEFFEIVHPKIGNFNVKSTISCRIMILYLALADRITSHV